MASSNHCSGWKQPLQMMHNATANDALFQQRLCRRGLSSSSYPLSEATFCFTSTSRCCSTALVSGFLHDKARVKQVKQKNNIFKKKNKKMAIQDYAIESL